MAHGVKPIETRTFVFNEDISKMSEQDVTRMITALKSEIDTLKKTLPEGVTSVRINQQIADRTAAIQTLVARLDSFAAAEGAAAPAAE